MSEHPGIVFRPGPTGRRAGLVGGPDVWEAVRAIKSARSEEADLTEDGLLALVTENTGISARLLQVAIRYWASYPAEIDAEITAADAAEEQAAEEWIAGRSLAQLRPDPGAGFARDCR